MGILIEIPLASDQGRKEKLRQALSARFAKTCNSEACWLDNEELNTSLLDLHPELYDRIHSSILKPKATPGKQDWLSNSDIDNVMKQYTLVFKDFTYIGCFPSDYFQLQPGAFPLSVLHRPGRAAIIFNLDTSKQSGSHWVAVLFETCMSN